MSISSSLAAGVSGLAAHATRLASIADNISNSATYGYKRVETDFDSMVIGQTRNAGTYTAGGVQAHATRLIDQQGASVSTSNPLDLAIAGRGMLPVMPYVSLGAQGGDVPLQMTTTGSFYIDVDGVVRTDSGLVLLGWPADADGTIPVMSRDAISGLQPVIINPNQMAANPTTKMTLGVNLPATQTEGGASGDSWPLNAEYFGNLGAAESLNITFTPDVSGPPGSGMSNTWTLQIRDSATPDDPLTPGTDESLIGEYIVVFRSDQASGGLVDSITPVGGSPAYDATTGTVQLTVADGQGSIELTLGRPNDPSGLTQFSNSFAPTNISKNGSPAGNMVGIEVDERGYVHATYASGFTRTIYQIPLVDVPNINGLISLSNQAYQTSPDSGSFYLWDAGDGPTGAVLGYTRESSTTDVAAELTDLIQTQRAYSSNAKVIQTVDEMLQETTNLKR